MFLNSSREDEFVFVILGSPSRLCKMEVESSDIYSHRVRYFCVDWDMEDDITSMCEAMLSIFSFHEERNLG